MKPVVSIVSTLLFVSVFGAGDLNGQVSAIVLGAANLLGAGHTFAPAPGGGGGGFLPSSLRLPPGVFYVKFTAVTGQVSAEPGTALISPDGTGAGHPFDIASYGGIAGIIHSNMGGFLMGVFLDSTEPFDPAPARLTYTGATTALLEYGPLLRQGFFIGNGRAGAAATIQTFVVPAGATRLYFGTLDAAGWSGQAGYFDDNSGSFAVNVGFEIAIPAQVTWNFAPTVTGTGYTYKLVNAPAGMTVDTAGMISWTPTAAQSSSNHINIIFTASQGFTPVAQQVFNIRVVANPPTAQLFGPTNFIFIDAAATYFLTYGDAALAPVPIKLSDYGIQPGDWVKLQGAGRFFYEIYFDPTATAYSMCGVFSSSDTILATNNLNRVPGAIAASMPAISLNTYYGNFATDIPEDFDINTNGVIVQVPAGAAYLFVTPDDAVFYDNFSTDDEVYGLNISRVIFPPQVSIAPAGANVAVTWPTNATGLTLQSASSITGTFTNLPGATSPYTNPIIGGQQFFRLMHP